MQTLARDLRKTPPRIPETAGSSAATVDKARADLLGINGEYNFYPCGLGAYFWKFTGLDAAKFKEFVATGASDDEIDQWVRDNATEKDPKAIIKWNNEMIGLRLCDLSEGWEYFENRTNLAVLQIQRAKPSSSNSVHAIGPRVVVSIATAKCDVMNAARSLLCDRQIRLHRNMQFSMRSAASHVEDVHGRDGIIWMGIIAHLAHVEDPAVLEMAKKEAASATKDALSHYRQQFADIGMSNASDGVDTLRHLFVLLLGLGMRESSGKHCEGVYSPDGNFTAETAEAGMFQTSWNIRTAHPLLKPLFDWYRGHPSGFVDVFSRGVACLPKDGVNYGDGDGKVYQALAKTCPAFAAESTALALRRRRAHWAPVKDNKHEAEVRAEADELFLQVQKLVDEQGLCPVLA